MTPKTFYTTTGEPFRVTHLDDRAGILHPRGMYVLAEHNEDVPRLPAETFEAVRALCVDGERMVLAGRYKEAFERLTAALDLLPDPQGQWNAGGWILVALGENAVRAGDFEGARGPLVDAMWSPGTIGNPWVHLRLGQVRYETGDLKGAAEHLTRAYMGGGREIFEGLDPKYLALLTRVLRPPAGKDRL